MPELFICTAIFCRVDDGPKKTKEALTLLYQAYDEWPAVLTRTSCGDIISLLFTYLGGGLFYA